MLTSAPTSQGFPGSCAGQRDMREASARLRGRLCVEQTPFKKHILFLNGMERTGACPDIIFPYVKLSVEKWVHMALSTQTAIIKKILNHIGMRRRFKGE